MTTGKLAAWGPAMWSAAGSHAGAQLSAAPHRVVDRPRLSFKELEPVSTAFDSLQRTSRQLNTLQTVALLSHVKEEKYGQAARLISTS